LDIIEIKQIIVKEKAHSTKDLL